ncbi:MAG: nickel-dependent lactate racemase [Negativicutes bacterium]|nr:nickel-dependent lactate racemase [Negativicutes bacterium]
MSKQLEIPWGKEKREFRIPAQSLAWTATPKDCPAVADEQGEILQAIRSPVGGPSLRALVTKANGTKTAILVDDATRVTPVAKILPILLDELNDAGVPDRQIKVILALGSHRFMTSAEIRDRIGPCADRVEAINHAYNDPSQLVRLGVTKAGTPIIVNRVYYESDISIGISNIIPHFIAGWSGGAKIVQPGVSGEETTARIHLNGSLSWPTILGNAENPIRHEMEEVARLSGLKMVVNTVLNLEERIVRVIAGDIVLAHREAVRHARMIYEFQIKEQPDIVIAGSYPANKDFWQADKALAAATLMVKPGGTVILAAPCVEGISPEHPILLELGDCPAQEVYERAGRGEFKDPIGVTAHIKIGVMREMARVILVSQGVSQADTERMGFRFAPDIDSAVGMALAIHGKAPRIGVITHGADIAPVIG